MSFAGRVGNDLADSLDGGDGCWVGARRGAARLRADPDRFEFGRCRRASRADSERRTAVRHRPIRVGLPQRDGGAQGDGDGLVLVGLSSEANWCSARVWWSLRLNRRGPRCPPRRFEMRDARVAGEQPDLLMGWVAPRRSSESRTAAIPAPIPRLRVKLGWHGDAGTARTGTGRASLPVVPSGGDH
jgi:hypothetical protein